MNDKDKILISSYLDNELSADEKKYVESLLESSSDAFDFLNALKSSSNEIDMFFNSHEIKDLTNNIDKFINQNKPRKTIIFSKENFYNYSKYFAGAASFALIMIFIFPTFIDENIETITLVNVERNAGLYKEETSLDINKIISDGIYEMVKRDMTKANIVIGDENIQIIINDDNLSNCLKGEFLYEDIKKEFTSCLVDNKYDIKIN